MLAGRRGDRRPSLRSPLLGLLLVGVGIADVRGRCDRSGDGSVTIAGSAVVSVLGMILLVPVVVATLARLARRLPLVARYAVRDAARHRTRTVPAVAAVAATVAGVVALGIANASDAAESEATYQPAAGDGDGHAHRVRPRRRLGELRGRRAPRGAAVGVTAVQSYDPFQRRHLHRPPGQATGRQGLRHAPGTLGGSFGSLLAGPRCSCSPTPAHAEDLEARTPGARPGRRRRLHHRAGRGRPDPRSAAGSTPPPTTSRERLTPSSCRRTSCRSGARRPASRGARSARSTRWG